MGVLSKRMLGYARCEPTTLTTFEEKAEALVLLLQVGSARKGSAS